MFDRFTDRARSAMGLARAEALYLNHQYIGTDHFLLGLLREGGSTAATVLNKFGINFENAKAVVVRLTQPGLPMLTMGHLAWTPRAKKTLEMASAGAQSFNHNYIGTEHLLYGMLLEGNGTGVAALEQLVFDTQNIMNELLGVLDPQDNSREDSSTNTVNSFDQYQEFTKSTAMYPGSHTGGFEAVTYTALKGAGEAGEYCEKLGKTMRGAGITAISRENMSEELRLGLAKELGDRLWYISQSAEEIGFKLSDIVNINIKKLTSRKTRGVIHGSGDNR